MAVCAGGGGGGGSVTAAAEMVLGDWATVGALHGGARRIKTRSAAHATRKASNSVRSLGRAHVMAAMLCCARARVGRMAGPGMAPGSSARDLRERRLRFVCSFANLARLQLR